MAWSAQQFSYFQNSAATNTGVAGNSTSVSGWTDIAGGLWNIVAPAITTGPAIGYAQNNYTGVSFVGQQLIRPAAETNTLYSRHVIQVATWGGGEVFCCLRVNSTGNTYYAMTYGGTGNGTSRVFGFNAGATTVVGALTQLTAAVAGHVYEMDFATMGATPTSLVANVYDVTLGRSLVAYGTFTDTANGPQVAGSAGIAQFSSGTAQLILNSESYSSGVATFSSTCGIKSSTTQNTVSAGVVGFPASVAPYTYKLYRDIVANPTAAGTLLQTVTAPTAYTDTPPGPGLYYYGYKLNDTGSTVTGVTSTNAAQLPVPYVICAIGDSLTQGQTQVGTGFDPVSQIQSRLAALLRPSVVTVINGGVGGTQTSDWLGGGANLPGAMTSFKAAATAAGAAAKVYVQIMLGTNDTKFGVLASAYVSNLTNTIAALKSAGIANLAGIILHNPPALGLPAQVYFGFSDAGNASLVSYAAAISALVDNVTVFAGDTTAFAWAIANQGTAYGPDNLHLSDVGYGGLATAWAKAINNVVSPGGGGAITGAIGNGGTSTNRGNG